MRGGASARAASRSARIRVASYNVLSPDLCSPEVFPHCRAEDLERSTRYSRVINHLKEEVARGSICCLQEISLSWAGPLQAFFAQNNYQLITTNYGDDRSGYMGVAMAIPMHAFDILSVDMTRLADERSDWPEAPPPYRPSLLKRYYWSAAKSIQKAVKRSIGYDIGDPKPGWNPWRDSQRRQNRMIFSRLQCRDTGRTFCLSTYHMPCAFLNPAVMVLQLASSSIFTPAFLGMLVGAVLTVPFILPFSSFETQVIHSALWAQRTSRLAVNDPYILAGDLNIKPSDSMYRLLTTGELEQGNPDLPPDLGTYSSWRPDLQEPLQSAYASFKGEEPEFTNYAQFRDQAEPFYACIDYVFVSKGGKVVGVKDLPRFAEVKDTGPFPNPHEPSDHVLIAADVEL